MTFNRTKWDIWCKQADELLADIDRADKPVNSDIPLMDRIVLGSPVAAERDKAAGISFNRR